MPSGLNATLFTQSSWPRSGGPTGWPVAASHNRMVLSPPAEAIRVPSGLNATLFTQSSWPRNGGPTGCPVAASHNRTVLSTPAEAIRVPSGLNATLFTESSWPRSGGPTGCPVAASHNRTVSSPPPEAIRVPSGLNATLVHRVLVATQRWPDRLPGRGVPQPDGLVVAAGGDPGPVRAERHTDHRVLVAMQRWPDRLPGRGVPQPDGPVVAAGGDPGTVRAERHGCHARRHIDDLEQVTLLIQHREQLILPVLVGGRNGARCQHPLHDVGVVAAFVRQVGLHQQRLPVQPLRGHFPEPVRGALRALPPNASSPPRLHPEQSPRRTPAPARLTAA